jgi:hypothetical protein
VGDGSRLAPSHSSPMVLFICEKRLECPCGLKWKLLLLKGSLVRLQLQRTWRHWTDHLSLLFHVTSAMMPHAPSVVAPLLVLRQNRKTLTWLTSHQSKPPDIDACPHTVFIHPSVLRHKSTNLLPLDFEAQAKKLSRWFWGLNHQTIDLGFEAQTKKPLQWFWGQTTDKPSTLVLRPKAKNYRSGFEAKALTTVTTSFEAKLGNLPFSSPARVRCGSHTVLPDFPIVRPPSTRLVTDHP